MNLWTPQTRHFTNTCSTADAPSMEDIVASMKQAKRKFEEIESRTEPAFRNLRYPIQDNLIESPYLTDRVQVRFPRSKKKRIRRKWAKDQKNYDTVPKNVVYVVDGRLVMYTSLARRLSKELSERTSNRIG